MIGRPVALIQVPNQRGFTIAEAARYLGMHMQTLRKLSDLGEIPCRRVGRHRLFLLDDLDRWLESQPKWVSHGNS
jgi:excisionase family DNA binding protein